jgi:hypothetical protein
MYEATINRARRTITFRASGTIAIDEVKKMFEEAKSAHDSFRGHPHLVLADMRGMAPMSPEGTKIFGELIRYGREHGCVCCVHLSDSSIGRLQASRLAREASPYDDITVNVVSLEEAERVIQERQASLGAPKTKAS